jgi:hypothetical protein
MFKTCVCGSLTGNSHTASFGQWCINILQNPPKTGEDVGKKGVTEEDPWRAVTVLDHLEKDQKNLFSVCGLRRKELPWTICTQHQRCFMAEKENRCEDNLALINSLNVCKETKEKLGCICSARSQLTENNPRSVVFGFENKTNLATRTIASNITEHLQVKLGMKMDMSEEDVVNRLPDLPLLNYRILCEQGQVCASGLLGPECLKLYQTADEAAQKENGWLGPFGKTIAYRDSKTEKIQLASCVPFQTFFVDDGKVKCQNSKKHPKYDPDTKDHLDDLKLAHGQICFVFIDKTTCPCGTDSEKNPGKPIQCKRGQICTISEGKGSCQEKPLYYGCAKNGNCYCTEKWGVRSSANTKDSNCLVDYSEGGDAVEERQNAGKYYETPDDKVEWRYLVRLSPEIIVGQMWLKKHGADLRLDWSKLKTPFMQQRSLRVKKTLRAIV